MKAKEFLTEINSRLHWPSGTRVTWHYRSGIGHGTIKSIAKNAETHAETLYNITQHDHHEGEPEVVQHYGKALSKSD